MQMTRLCHVLSELMPRRHLLVRSIPSFYILLFRLFLLNQESTDKANYYAGLFRYAQMIHHLLTRI